MERRPSAAHRVLAVGIVCDLGRSGGGVARPGFEKLFVDDNDVVAQQLLGHPATATGGLFLFQLIDQIDQVEEAASGASADSRDRKEIPRPVF